MGTSHSSVEWTLRGPTRLVSTDARTAVPLEDQPYLYQPLSCPTTIRLIKILPNKIKGHVVCRLYHFDPSGIPQYTALSYLWGDPTPTGKVYIGDDQVYNSGHTFARPIHESLLGFLECMWVQHKYDTYFWTDSLCLDQGNAEEKSHQVPRMGGIYERAVETLIWLGHQKETQEALRIASTPPKAFHEEIHGRRDRAEALRRTPFRGNSVEEAKVRRLYYEGLAARKHLFQLPYWRRVWIVQEIVLSKRLRLASGDEYIEWDKFFSSHLLKSPISKFEPYRSFIYDLDRLRRAGARKPLWELITLGTRRESTRAVDRIYGLLGLATDFVQGVHISRVLEVDYNKTPQEVYWDTLFECKPVTTEAWHYDLKNLGALLGTEMNLYHSLEDYTYTVFAHSRISERKRAFGQVALGAFDAANTFMRRHNVRCREWRSVMTEMTRILQMSKSCSRSQYAAIVGLALASLEDEHAKWLNDVTPVGSSESVGNNVSNKREAKQANERSKTFLKWRQTRISQSSRQISFTDSPDLSECVGATLYLLLAMKPCFVFEIPDIAFRLAIDGPESKVYLRLGEHQ